MDEEDTYLIGERGRDYVKRALVKEEPAAVIRKLQEKYKLSVYDEQMETYNELLKGCQINNRNYEVNVLFLNKIVSCLNNYIITEEGVFEAGQLMRIIDELKPYYSSEKISPILITLINKYLHVIPGQYLRALVDEYGAFFSQWPNELKLRFWQHCAGDHFTVYAEALLMSKGHDVIEIVKVVKGNNALCSRLTDLVRSLYADTGNQMFCAVRYEIGLVSEWDRCHPLVRAFDTCFKSTATAPTPAGAILLDKKYIRDIQKFFDGISRDGPIYADIAMILNSVSVLNLLVSHLLLLLHDCVARDVEPKTDASIIWVIRVICLARDARRMIKEADYQIPPVDKLLTHRFLGAFHRLISNRLSEEDQRVFAELVGKKEGRDHDLVDLLVAHYLIDRLTTAIDIPAVYRIVDAAAVYLDPYSDLYTTLATSITAHYCAKAMYNAEQAHLLAYLVDRILLPTAMQSAAVHKQLALLLLELVAHVAVCPAVVKSALATQLPVWIEKAVAMTTVGEGEIAAIYYKLVEYVRRNSVSNSDYPFSLVDVPGAVSYYSNQRQ